MINSEINLKQSKFSRFLNMLKEDLRPESQGFWFQMLACLIITGSIVLSFFFSAFCYVSGILLLVLVIFSSVKENVFGSALNIIVYFYAFSSVLFIPNRSFGFYPIIVALYVAIIGLKWLVDVIKKRENINVFSIVCFGCYILYAGLLFVLKHFSFSSLFSIVLGTLLLFLIGINRSGAKLKDVLFAFLLGILISSFIGLFAKHFTNLSDFYDFTHAYGVSRFSGLFSNTNSLSRLVMLGLAALFTLLLTKKLKVLYYPIFFILFLIAISTLSKTVFVILAATIFSAFIILFVKETKKRNAVITLILTAVVGLGAVFFQSNNFKVLWNRIISPIKQVVVENKKTSEEKIKDDYSFVSDFTTGRTELWAVNIKEICDDFSGFVFGHGHGSDYSIGDPIEEDSRLSSPHNTYLQYTYHMGVLGLILFALCLLSIIKQKKLSIFGLPFAIAIILILGMSDSFSYIGFIFLSLAIICMRREDDDRLPKEVVENNTEIKNKLKIPKKIHYIWLGGKPLPPIAEKCIESWKKYCPDYEIKRWDETNLNIDITNYSRTAYDMKKFAFVSDVLRFDILNREGGIYLDIDVEIIKNLDKFLEDDFFCGFESEKFVNPGIILGSVAGHRILKSTFESYKTREFKFDPNNQITVCNILTEELVKYGMTPQNSYQRHEDFTVYPMEYFCPKSLTDGKIRLTKNTHGIHHFAGTWIKTSTKIKSKILQIIKRIMGPTLVSKLKNLRNQKDSGTDTLQKTRVLNLLASNKYSGAENVACQIIQMCDDKELEQAYASLDGEIRNVLNGKAIKFYPMNSFRPRELRRVIKEFNPNIIHAHDMKAVCLASIFGKGKTVVAHIHRNHTDFHSKTIRAYILKFLAKLKRLKTIFWVSDACYNDYIFKEDKNIKAKSKILYNIINRDSLIKKAQEQQKDKGHDLLFVGRLSDIKNPLRLLDITKLLSQQIPNISVGIIGDGELIDECRNKVKELDLSRNVTIYGFKSDFQGILSNSKIFLLTSRTEGIPMSILEAQTFGLPIVAPNIHGLDQIVKNNKMGILYNSNEEAVEYIAGMLKNKDCYNEAKKAIIDFSIKYNDVDNYKQSIKKTYLGD